MDKKNKKIVPRPELTTLAETDLTKTAEASAGGLLEHIPSINRRNFLKGAGFSISALMLAACSRAPVQNAIPLLIQPEEIVPGQALWYASTCHGCTARCGVLVKNRDGRPIKLEGNSEHPLSQGGLCAVGQSQVLGLYDSLRINQPLAAGQPVSWAEADQSVASAIAASVASGKSIVILTESILSPSTKYHLERFTTTHANARHVTYDPLSSSAILQAQQINFGRPALPQYHFDQADVIVSIDADFLGTWISPVEFTSAWSSRRRPTAKHPEMSYHVQFEGRMSLSGSKADQRFRLSPEEVGATVSQLAVKLASLSGQLSPSGTAGNSAVAQTEIHALAVRLHDAKGESVVLCDSTDVAVQTLVNWINQTLGNYGKTVDIDRPSRQRQGRDADVLALVEELAAGTVQEHSGAGLNAQKLVALTDTPVGGTIDDAYTVAATVRYGAFNAGQRGFLRLAASASAVVIGKALESDGDGTVRILTTDTATDDTQRDSIVAYAVEAVDNSGGGSEVFIEVRFA
ncbi:MAG: hypothetical protein IID15_02330 [Candidatus Marinimicrobia bacterium]|nr:hypothetical protein [Candidatus Neomarinimicrobiota bacterium]